ncbi:MAG: hypothetical protein R3B09_15245 [Nannocystaceae bacterium]
MADDADDRGRRAEALVPEGEAWRGDDHALQVAAAEEIGLTRGEVAVDLYRRGFTHGLTAKDPVDGALVLRGRTVLRDDQLLAAMKKIFRHLHLAVEGLRVRVHDGQFEIRIASSVADDTSAALANAMRRALYIWVLAALFGALAYSIAPALALLVAGPGLLLGGFILRRGIEEGRVAFTLKMVDELALLADREQLILPPAKREGA